ncbi:MAG: glycosyltransferase family 4 protein [Thermoplasmatales archaeon]
MRILWLGHRDIRHPSAGGAERTMYEVSRRLVRAGFNVTLATVNPGDLKEFDVIEGVNIIRMRGNIMAHLNVPFTISNVKPDVIIDDLAHVVPWFSSYFTDKRVIAFFRHLHARSLSGQVNPVMAKILSFLEGKYGHIYKNSTFVTESITSINDLVNLGIEKERICRILPGVNHELFKMGKKFEDPTLIYFGGMRDYKRPWMALSLMKMFRDKNFKLIIVGSGKSSQKVETVCEKYSICDRVNFTGRLSDEGVAESLKSSWINVHFSMTEGFGYSLLEAAASGTPTVALDSPGVSEVINEFGLGLVARDLGDMKVKIEEIIEGYRQWSNKVHENSLRFSWDKSAKEWEKLFRSLI